MKLLSQLAPRILVILSLTVAFSQSYAESKTHKANFSQAELDQMLAPIALYPDNILSQLLIASTYPIEIIQADRWVKNHPDVKGAEAVKQVEHKDWDPSVKSMVAFPDILGRMSDDIDWTQKIGDAFLANEDQVMNSIQHLRKKAYTSGTLGKVEHLRVQRTDDEIIIEPAEERVVYVPVYDTRVVYGNWWWHEHPPVRWHYPSSYTFVSGFYWGPSIYVGSGYYYSSCHWRERRVVVVDRFDTHRPRPSFHTSLSIVHYEGARTWSHNPVHRRGVAYYNNHLRDNYGSHHQSREESRVYRHSNSPQRQIRFDDEHRGNSRPPKETGVNFGLPTNGNLNPSPHAVQSREYHHRVENIENQWNNNDQVDNSRSQRERAMQHEARQERETSTNHVSGGITQYNDEQVRNNNRIMRYNNDQPRDVRSNRPQENIIQPTTRETYNTTQETESPNRGMGRPNFNRQTTDSSPAYLRTPQDNSQRETRQPERVNIPQPNIAPTNEQAQQRIIRNESTNVPAPPMEDRKADNTGDLSGGMRAIR